MKKLNKRQRELKNNLLQTLKIEREKQMTQAELSYMTDISAVTICQMEHKQKSVNLDTFILLADALGLDVTLTKKQ